MDQRRIRISAVLLVVVAIGCVLIVRHGRWYKTEFIPPTNLARLATVLPSSTPPNYYLSAKNIHNLNDGSYAPSVDAAGHHELWIQPSAVTWVTSGNANIVIMFDLGSVQPIEGVSMSTAAGSSGVYWPKQIWLYVRDTETEPWMQVGNIVDPSVLPPYGIYSDFSIAAHGLHASGKQVALVIVPGGVSSSKFVTTDEVEIYQGTELLHGAARGAQSINATTAKTGIQINDLKNNGALPLLTSVGPCAHPPAGSRFLLPRAPDLQGWLYSAVPTYGAAVTSDLAPPIPEPFVVTGIENDCSPVSLTGNQVDAFWQRLASRVTNWGIATATSAPNPWSYPLLSRYYFGAYPNDRAATGNNTESVSGMLGQPVLFSPPLPGTDAQGRTIQLAKTIRAPDVECQPVMRSWVPNLEQHCSDPGDSTTCEIWLQQGSQYIYSSRYYPRFIPTDADLLLQSYLLTRGSSQGDKQGQLLNNALNFMLYVQYQPGADTQVTNRFVTDWYAPSAAKPTSMSDTDFALWEQKAQSWLGGFDDQFDWEWTDHYNTGYTWSLHETDHHMAAAYAYNLAEGYETMGVQSYLDAADAFLKYQIPRYGYHSGIWGGRRYYWTEYNPTGLTSVSGINCADPALDWTNPANISACVALTGDAVDNVQSLVARTAAIIGYNKRNKAYLEFARGLLWYIAREYAADGRLYYYGSESNRNFTSRTNGYELVALNDAIDALSYLVKAGWIGREDPLFIILTRAYASYAYSDYWLWECEAQPGICTYPADPRSGLGKQFTDNKVIRAWSLPGESLNTPIPFPTIHTYLQLTSERDPARSAGNYRFSFTNSLLSTLLASGLGTTVKIERLSPVNSGDAATLKKTSVHEWVLAGYASPDIDLTDILWQVPTPGALYDVSFSWPYSQWRDLSTNPNLNTWVTSQTSTIRYCDTASGDCVDKPALNLSRDGAINAITAKQADNDGFVDYLTQSLFNRKPLPEVSFGTECSAP